MLAAGGSSRLGRPKQLLEYQGKPLVQIAALAARDAGYGPVVVVVGSDADKVLVALQNLDGITSCINTAWRDGLASSLKAGLRAVSEIADVDALLVTVADQPKVSAEVLAKLADSFASGNRLVAASYNAALGVPAIFGKEYFDDLGHLSGDSGAGQWLRRRANEVSAIEMTDAAFDIDTESDVRKLMLQRDEIE